MAFSVSEFQLYRDGLDVDNEMPAHAQQFSACRNMFQTQTGARSDECACRCIRLVNSEAVWSSRAMHVNMCVEKHSHSQQTKPFYLMLLREGAADIRLTDISQPCDNTANTHGSISVHVKGEPSRLALLHACLDWVGAVKGVAALK